MSVAQKFANERLINFQAGNTQALVAQYAPDAIVITPAGVLRGHEQIAGMIEGILKEFGQPGVTFTLLTNVAEGDVVSFTWRARTADNDYDLGAETYVLANGLARYQTFAANIIPH
jgi:ketosteroid isomerase-like protein